MAVEIAKTDYISRCIIFDRFFQSNVHTDELLWVFGKTSETTGASHESAVLRRLSPKPDDVHSIGCAIARYQNVGRGDPPPGDGRRYYCGFRTAAVSDIPIEGEGYRIKLTSLPENGVESHVDVAVTITAQGRSAKATRRTDAGIALAEQFGPPEPHICECDVADDYHPFNRWGTSCLFSGLLDRWPDLYIPGIKEVIVGSKPSLEP